MGCKALFIGGIKSGKSKNAEEYTLKIAKEKPIYLATNEFFDDEMKKRVQLHKEQRVDNFSTLEEPLNLANIIKLQHNVVLVECVSMWINNMLYHKFNEEDMLKQLEKIEQMNTQTIWVINDVSCSVVSENKLVREFVDINGRISQFLASRCEEVYNTVAGISVKIK
ncbi:MAG: adenosylcobinamide kinase/adenosylcobinamide-phosphate guanylyltransferase [Sulfurimonas sp.]|jgi:adenosylcobinamide kinase/adenosylcobinamide-phosphate guanylyltransferase|uniref:bifunctional adenosylcobinamide kinase/adenosylcobinamide-phosphate guanylyltransferase n=1 Tax=Sulfurimonas sp. TaxID=2022749 RepID=UPI0039E5ABA3